MHTPPVNDASREPVTPLSWCMPALHQVLQSVLQWVDQVLAAVGAHAQAVVVGQDEVRDARARIQQVAAVLRCVQQPALACVLAGVSRGLDACEWQEAARAMPRLRAIDTAICAVLAGGQLCVQGRADWQMVVLWPAYEALMQDLGEASVAPVDLFVADPRRVADWSVPEQPGATLAPADAWRCLQGAPWDGLGADTDWAALREAAWSLAGAEPGPGMRCAVFQCMAAVFEALQGQVLDWDEQMHRLLVRMSSQLAQVSHPGCVFEPRVLHECLFGLAHARAGARGVDAVRAYWHLDELVAVWGAPPAFWVGRARALPPQVQALHELLADPHPADELLQPAWRAALASLAACGAAVLPEPWERLLGALRDRVLNAAPGGRHGVRYAPLSVAALWVLEHAVTESVIDAAPFERAAAVLVASLTQSQADQPDSAPWWESVSLLLRPAATRQAVQTFWHEVHAVLRSWEAELLGAMVHSRPVADWRQRCAELTQLMAWAGQPDLAQGLARLSAVVAQQGQGALCNASGALTECQAIWAMVSVAVTGVAHGVQLAWQDVVLDTQSVAEPCTTTHPEIAPGSPPASDVGLAAKVSGEAAHEPGVSGLAGAFAVEAAAALAVWSTMLESWLNFPDDPAPRRALLRSVHTIKGAAALAGASVWAARLHEWEGQIVALSNPSPAQGQTLLQGYVQLSAECPRPEGVSDRTVRHVAGWSADADLSWLDRVTCHSAALLSAGERWVGQLDAIRQAVLDLDETIRRVYDSQMGRNEAHAGMDLSDLIHEHDDMLADRLPVLVGVSHAPMTPVAGDWMPEWVAAQQRVLQQIHGAQRAWRHQQDHAKAIHHVTRDVVANVAGRLSARLQHVAHQRAHQVGKTVELVCVGADLDGQQELLSALRPALEHLVCNAVVHGVESEALRLAHGKPVAGQIEVRMQIAAGELVVSCVDDGAGLDWSALTARATALGLPVPNVPDSPDAKAWLPVLTHAGLSSAIGVTEWAGRGLGLDVVSSTVQAQGGTLALESRPGAGVRWELRVPVRQMALRVVSLGLAAGQVAVPAADVEQVCALSHSDWLAACVRGHWFSADGLSLPCVDLAQLLGWAHDAPLPAECTVVVLRHATTCWAVRVDTVSDPYEVSLMQADPRLAGLPGLLGVAVSDDAEALLIVDILQTAQRLLTTA